MNSLRTKRVWVACAALLFTAVSARADVILSATSKEGNKLVTVNLTAGTVSDLHLTSNGQSPDSLIVLANGKILYDEGLFSQLRLWDPVANTDIYWPMALWESTSRKTWF